MFQRIKYIITTIAISFNRLLRRISNAGSTAFYFPIKKFSIPYKQVFFGYYDKTPFSLDNTKLLAMTLPLDSSVSPQSKSIELGYFDISYPEQFNSVAKSETWCWQQGCRLQWFPQDMDRLIMYNLLENNQYRSVIQDIITKKIIRKYLFPIYDIDKSGKKAITLNFSRLQRLRPGYGYSNLNDPSINEFCPSNDGVFLIDLDSGDKKLIISIAQLAAIDPLESMKGAEHYVNCLSFNPNGDRFMVFHVWTNKRKRFTRVFTIGTDGDNPYLLTHAGKVSHYCWKSNRELLLGIFHEKEGFEYKLFTDLTDEQHIVGANLLTFDGHPTYSPDAQYILIDTYPDKYSDQKLMIISNQNQIKEIGRFFSAPKFRGEARCDLHPRWDRKQKYVCIDSPHNDCRAMYCIDVSIAVNKGITQETPNEKIR